MAAIQKRGNVFRVRIIRKGYQSQSKTFSTRIEAVKWARKIETEIDQGVIKPSKTLANRMLDKQLSFGEVAEHYIKNHSIHKRNCKTETGTIRALIRNWGQAHVQSIDKAKVFALRDDLLSRGRSGDTVNHYYNAISKIYQMLQTEWSITVDNPIKGIKRLPANPSRTKRINREAESALLFACKQSTSKLLKPIIQFALETGMRRGEFMGLKWIDIDLPSRRAFLNVTKNGEPRQVPLTLKAVQILNEVKNEHPEQVFPISMDALRRYFEKAVKTAKDNWTSSGANPFDGWRLHDVRHEALSRLSDTGLNVIELSHISGHKTLSMLSRYVHPSHEAIFAKLDEKICKNNQT
jgi:integrase